MFSLTPTVKNLMIINLILFGLNWLLLPVLQQPLYNYLSLHFLTSSDFGFYQLFTHFFTYADPTHVFFNLISLFFMGTLLESFWGAKRFLNFYLISGVMTGVIFIFLQLSYSLFILGHPLPQNEIEEIMLWGSRSNVELIGANGVNIAVFTAVAMLFPNTEFMLFFIPYPIKAKYLWMGIVILDVFLGFSKSMGSSVVHYSHLGGILIAFILVKIYNRDKTRFY